MTLQTVESPELVLVASPEDAAAARRALPEPYWMSAPPRRRTVAPRAPEPAPQPAPQPAQVQRPLRERLARMVVTLAATGLVISGVVLGSRQLNTIIPPPTATIVAPSQPLTETLTPLESATSPPAPKPTPKKPRQAPLTPRTIAPVPIPGAGYVNATGDRFRVSPNGRSVVGLTVAAGCAGTLSIPALQIIGRTFVYSGSLRSNGVARAVTVEGTFASRTRATIRLRARSAGCDTGSKLLSTHLS